MGGGGIEGGVEGGMGGGEVGGEVGGGRMREGGWEEEGWEVGLKLLDVFVSCCFFFLTPSSPMPSARYS